MRSEADRARLVAAAEARLAWIRAAEAQARLTMAESGLRAVARHREAVEARVTEGNSSGIDLRLARLDEAAAAGEVLVARRDARAARAELAAQTGIAEAEAEGDPLLAAPASWTTGERADLVPASSRIEVAEASLSAERASVLPALGVGAFVERDDGISRFGPALTVELPLWTWNSGGRAEAQRDLDLARAESASLEARIQVEQATTGDEDLLGHLGATPSEDAEAVLAAVDAAWQAGAFDAIEASLLRARALDGQRAWLAARAAIAEARVEAALAAGSPDLLPASLCPSPSPPPPSGACSPPRSLAPARPSPRPCSAAWVRSPSPACSTWAPHWRRRPSRVEPGIGASCVGCWARWCSVACWGPCWCCSG